MEPNELTMANLFSRPVPYIQSLTNMFQRVAPQVSLCYQTFVTSIVASLS